MAMVSKLMLAQGHASGSSCIAVGAVLLSSVVRGGMVQRASLIRFSTAPIHDLRDGSIVCCQKRSWLFALSLRL